MRRSPSSEKRSRRFPIVKTIKAHHTVLLLVVLVVVVVVIVMGLRL